MNPPTCRRLALAAAALALALSGCSSDAGEPASGTPTSVPPLPSGLPSLPPPPATPGG